MEPLISIIIPYYKAKDYIAQCVESLLSQSEKRIEIIIAVDKKDEDGKKYLESKNWPKVRVISGGNEVSANRNAGLDAAIGKYVYFIDADDFLIRNDTFETLLKGAEENIADLSIGEFDLYLNESDEFAIGGRLSAGPGLITVKEALEMSFATRTMFVSIWNCLFRRKFIADERLDETMVAAEDGYYMLRMLRKKPRIYCAKGLVSYGYRKGQSYSSDSKNVIKRMSGWMKMREEGRNLIENEYPELMDTMYLDYFKVMLGSLLVYAEMSSKKDGTFKEGKELYKDLRKRCLAFGKLPKKYLTVKKERGMLALLKLNLLWRYYRIRRVLFPRKGR